jgi:hypothetical protein
MSTTIPITSVPTDVKARPRRKRKPTTGLPYASATSNMRARREIEKILLLFGCEKIGFMDDHEKHEVLLYFVYRGQEVHWRVSAKGWAQAWLKKKPWNYQRRSQRVDYEQAALRQGQIAVNSILRDRVKSQISAIECGMESFAAVFMPYMLTSDGRTVVERINETKLLPAPTEEKVVQLQGGAA